MKIKKKYAMAWAVFSVGALLVFIDPASLLAWTAFSTMVLGVFSAADVADKRLNGGNYNGPGAS